jgi:hypothetical protein
MSVWTKLRGLFNKQPTPTVARPQITSTGEVPCFVCDGSFLPGDHHCPAQPQPTDLYTRFIATHKALKGLLLAVETDSLTQEDLDKARAALRLA